MDREQVNRVLDGLTERLSALEHERWSHWQKYLHNKCERRPDGSLLMPADLVARWERPMSTDYSDLSEEEKQSDREQVRKYLPIIASAFTNSSIPAKTDEN